MIYLKDSYTKSFEEKILLVEGDKIITQDSSFYAQSGGQPGDKGVLEINDKKFYIPHVKKEIIEKNSNLKPGFFVQMKLFMENKLSINIQRYINTLKLIRYLSNA